VALRHLQLLEEWDVLATVTTTAAALTEALAAHIESRPGVGAVRQRGLMAGVELAPPPGGERWGRRVCARAVDQGVLLRPLGDVVVVMPPLTTTVAEIDHVIEVLAASIAAVWDEDRPGPSAGGSQ
jgi:adenosylmethionine-8-amino-7-oxononanoate aminotransferase